MNRNELGNKIFNLEFSIYIIQAVGIFSSMETKPPLGYLNYVILLLLGIKIILSKYSKVQIFLVAILLAFGVWLYVITEVGDLMLFIWFVIAARDVELRKTFSIALKVFAFSIAFGVFLCILGPAADVIKTMTDGTIGHSYGFTTANTLSLLIFQPILIGIFLRYKNFKIRDYLIIILIELIAYYVTRCRSTLITCIVLLILLPNIKALSSRKYSKKILSLLAFTSPFCAFVSYFSVFLYSQGGAALSALDLLGSSRISNAYINIIRYGLHFMPIANNPVYSSPFTLDNSYIRIGTHFGILVLILIIYIYTRSMFIMYRNEEYERLTVLVTICILSLFETNLYRLSINVAILLLAEGLYNSGRLNASNRKL